VTATSAELVERGDLDELTRHVDGLAETRDWDGLVDLRDRCRRALERGKQLWPVAAHVEYRLALEAPGRWAARVLEAGAGQFSFGPLAEVTASTHSWDELAPHVPVTPAAAVAAHERVLRGEDLRDDAIAASLPHVLELPLLLEAWEPRYAVAEYHADRAEFPVPVVPIGGEPVALPAASPRADDPQICRALAELAMAWTTESNGRAEAVAARGSAEDALAALGLRRARIRSVPPSTAIALMAWTGASGGAHGRRRGAAAGRFAAWWVLHVLAGDTDEAMDADVLGEVADELSWFVWDAGEPDTGWSLRLAVADPNVGEAWAVAATDAR
jgi:hypothetical protein